MPTSTINWRILITDMTLALQRKAMQVEILDGITMSNLKQMVMRMLFLMTDPLHSPPDIKTKAISIIA